MDSFDGAGRAYAWYPNTAIALCAISYGDMDGIADAVRAQTGLRVVWGPAELDSWDGISYSRAFVAGDPATGEYFVVVRGTNFDSIPSWRKEDFDLTPAWFGGLPGLPAGVPATAMIAQGTFNGMSDLLRLRDPGSGLSLPAYLGALQPGRLYVTGHSLGGTLTPPLFAYLNAALHGGGPAPNMALWSFAGLTAGGTGFNAYFNAMLADPQGFQWRIQNSLDIAPLCWWSRDGIDRVYKPYGLDWDCVDKDAVDDLFADAAASGVGYSHPQPGLLLPGAFDHGIVDGEVWALQALHQHHSQTYQALVAARFPQAG